jgi:predicted transcriptional regulator
MKNELTTIQVSKALAGRLRKIATRENRSVSKQAQLFLAEAVLRSTTIK